MKILGIVCSPRKGGNTEILVKEALDAAKVAGADKAELVSLAEKDIAPCTACELCFKTGKCTVQDDFQEIYEKLLEYDGIVLGTPVYFWGVSAQAKLLIDRTYCLATGHLALFPGLRKRIGEQRKGLRNKAAGIIVVAARAGAANAFGQLSDFIRAHRMREAGGCIAYALKSGEVLNDEQGLREARWTGQAVVYTIKQSLR